MIVPLSLIGDVSVTQTRRHLLSTTRDLKADCFPQKDNRKKRIFKAAKLSTAVVTCEQPARQPKTPAPVRIHVYPWNSFEDEPRTVTAEYPDAALLDPVHMPLPLTDQANWQVCTKVYRDPNVVHLGAVADFVVARGEINQTTYKKFITTDSSKTRLVKGVEVGRYHMNPVLSQGEQEWFDETAFLKRHSKRAVVDERRIATQRITGVDELMRIVACIVPERAYFADSTNSIVRKDGSPYALEYLLALLNSALYQWRFKLTSTNNNVGTNELDVMPFRNINFDDPDDRARHDRIVRRVQQLIDELQSLSHARLAGEQEMLKRHVLAADAEIQQVVYDLYDLDDSDIAVVEGSKVQGSAAGAPAPSK